MDHEGYGGARVNTLDSFDRTHNLAFTWAYQLPFGQGQRWGADVSGVANQIIGNWRIMGWHNYMSGPPIFLGRVNRTGASIDRGVSHGSYDPNGPNKLTLNVDAFSPENQFVAFGDTDQLPDIRQFGYATENLSILKDFQLTEDVRFEFGAEFFNAFNRVQFHRLDTSISRPTSFGRYSRAALPRIIQIRLRIAF